ncbi:Crp/Fnr family transcriptional regulator [Chitinophaga japonensis]|uniref:CRP-like cAMP-binding protein n=1 Tax=Chitinophaga japonensis TaxID=104662 RepID=A0A562T4J2_CHIJA|nr:Crp/Fnr family transcriptional regulator [Chitinophaga japonensis]TWI88154.1 CRP-like cAMP-binding protein [Chitinophaga japonensis]
MFGNIHHFFLQMIPGLTDEAWQAFADRLQVKQYSKGEELSSAERVNHIISFIEQGAVIAFNVVDGKKHIYNFFFEREYVSDYESFLTREPARYGLEAIEDTTTIDLHYNDLQQLYLSHPVFERAGRMAAEAQFIRLARQISSLLAEKPEERYRNLLRDKPQVLQRVPQYLVASYLGVTPEALSRIRKRISL